MVSLFQPRFPTQPSPAGATVATTTFPTELAPFIKDILEKSKAQQEGAAYQAYTGPQLAQFTDAERAAMEAMRQQTTGLAGTDVAQATPYFAGAKTALEGLGQQFTGDVAQQFMNPYQQAVIDQAKRKAIEDYEQTIAPKVTAQAIAQQPFGGSRQAIAEGMAREALQEQLSDIQERGTAAAFDKGRAAFEAQKARELQQAQQLSQLGQTVPQQALRDLAIQQQLGEQERQQEQLALDLAKGQFMEEREFPTRALQEYSAIVRGFPFQPSTYQTSTQYQATPSVASQLLQLGGTGLGAYTAFTGKPLANVFGGATGGGIADIISNKMGENKQTFFGKDEEEYGEDEAARDQYREDARTLTENEFYNKYGVGGTNRRDVEDGPYIYPPSYKAAPDRIEAELAESIEGGGAPTGGPLPSYEEIERDFLDRKLKERDMRRMLSRAQGGLVNLPVVSNMAGINLQIPNKEEEDNTNQNVRSIFLPTDQAPPLEYEFTNQFPIIPPEQVKVEIPNFDTMEGKLDLGEAPKGIIAGERKTFKKETVDPLMQLYDTLGTKEELDRRRAEAEEAKNVNIGLSMMKAFGKARDPGLSLAQFASDVGSEFATVAEPGMIKYREDLKEIENIPRELLESKYAIGKDVLGTAKDESEEKLTIDQMGTSRKLDEANYNLNLFKNKFEMNKDKAQLDLTRLATNIDSYFKREKNLIDIAKNEADLIDATATYNKGIQKDIVDLVEKGVTEDSEMKALLSSAAKQFFGVELDSIDQLNSAELRRLGAKAFSPKVIADFSKMYGAMLSDFSKRKTNLYTKAAQNYSDPNKVIQIFADPDNQVQRIAQGVFYDSSFGYNNLQPELSKAGVDFFNEELKKPEFKDVDKYNFMTQIFASNDINKPLKEIVNANARAQGRTQQQADQDFQKLKDDYKFTNDNLTLKDFYFGGGNYKSTVEDSLYTNPYKINPLSPPIN